MKSLKCKNCGAVNKEGVLFCEVCEISLDIPPKQSKHNQGKENVGDPLFDKFANDCTSLNDRIDNIISEMEAKFQEIISSLKELKK